MQEYSYKNSSIEWLGIIPEHWKIDRLRDLCIVNDQAISNSTSPDFKLNYIDIGNVNSSGIVDFNKIEELRFGEAPSRARRKIQVGDTIISSVRTNLQAVAFIDFKREDLIGSTGFFVCRPRFSEILDNKFLYYFVLTDYSKDFFFSHSVGVSYPAIDDYKFSSINIPLPPLPEQKSIADYLDKACTRIDRIIAIKEEQLRKIEAQEKSKAFEILTNGIYENTPLKNSDIHWMDKMPKHWRRLRLKDVVSLKSGDSITSTDINAYDEYPVYGGNGLRGFTDSYTHDGYYPLIGRQGALCGNINYSKGNFYASEHAVVATPIRKCDVFWIGELMRVMDLNQYSNAAAQPGLAVERIKQLYIPYPGYNEQVVMSKQLNDLFMRNSKMKKLLDSQLYTLQSYRKSLIHECVTGKKQVADLAPLQMKTAQNA